jgi:peroxiredoxin
MALTYSPPGEAGSLAPSFKLPGIGPQGEGTWSLDDFAAARVLVVGFICNHCPYVKAIQTRFNDLAREYQARGVQVVGINPNDAVKYPDDNFAAMKERAREEGYVFPYLQDESQAVARAYGAVCTPDFYVYARRGADFALVYRGRLDDCWKDPSAVTQRDLARAVDGILAGEPPTAAPIASMGCSIKWKA